MVEEKYQQASGYVGTYKPTAFIDKNANVVFNGDVTENNINLPWGWFREEFKEFTKFLVYKIVQHNLKFFYEEKTELINHIDPQKFIEEVNRKHGYHIKYKPDTIRSISYRLIIAYQQRLYRVNFFLKKKLHLEKDDNFLDKKEIKEEIREIIEKHEGDEPISDLQIAKVLINGGTKIARRTVTKYRSQMGIKPSNIRKKIFS